MKKAALVIIKPDGIAKGIAGHILNKFSEANLQMVGLRLTRVSRELAKEHYQNIQGKPFFRDVIEYLIGQYHREKKVLIIIYYGEKAIAKCRNIAGLTNPEEAAPQTIRGAFGRITTKGVYENVVHVSSDDTEAEREVKLWFKPQDILVKLYPTKTIKRKEQTIKIWA